MPDETKELDALVSALNRSAERLQTLWFSFLAVTVYFAIAALTTTHRMLLLEEGQTLPLVNVKLPLLPFYIIAPAFYVLIHTPAPFACKAHIYNTGFHAGAKLTVVFESVRGQWVVSQWF
jgi:hypothetical protein